MCGGSKETSAEEMAGHAKDPLQSGQGERASNACMESGMRKQGMNW